MAYFGRENIFSTYKKHPIRHIGILTCHIECFTQKIIEGSDIRKH